MKISEVRPVDYMDGLRLPVMIILGLDDEMVTHKEARNVFLKCTSQLKLLRFVEGDHSSDRSDSLILSCCRFCDKSLRFNPLKSGKIFAERNEANFMSYEGNYKFEEEKTFIPDETTFFSRDISDAYNKASLKPTLHAPTLHSAALNDDLSNSTPVLRSSRQDEGIGSNRNTFYYDRLLNGKKGNHSGILDEKRDLDFANFMESDYPTKFKKKIEVNGTLDNSQSRNQGYFKEPIRVNTKAPKIERPVLNKGPRNGLKADDFPDFNSDSDSDLD